MIKRLARIFQDKGWVFWVTAAAALMSTGIVVTLFLYLLKESFPIVQAQGVSFLTGSDWVVGEVYGALPMILGSVLVTTLALILVLPLALGTALFTSEFLGPRWRWVVKSMMELLAGVPGILYGLLGVALLAVWVRDVFGLIDGNTLFTAGVLLAVMILPTIMTLSEDALRAVPGEYRETAWSLGLTRWETVTGVILPKALPGICGAVFLGLGRAMGETIAVMLVIGGLDRIPDPWYNLFSSGQSIPSKLGREAAEALGTDLQWHALMALGCVLFLLVMAMTLTGHLLLPRQKS